MQAFQFLYFRIITPNPLKQGLKHGKEVQSITELINYYPKSTKTRIETGKIPRIGNEAAKIITPNPLKQGLKLQEYTFGNVSEYDYYPKSTKTRIETTLLGIFLLLFHYYYPKSTKTRIETYTI